MPRIAVNSFVELDEGDAAGVPAIASAIGATVDQACPCSNQREVGVTKNLVRDYAKRRSSDATVRVSRIHRFTAKTGSTRTQVGRVSRRWPQHAGPHFDFRSGLVCRRGYANIAARELDCAHVDVGML